MSTNPRLDLSDEIRMNLCRLPELLPGRSDTTYLLAEYVAGTLPDEFIGPEDFAENRALGYFKLVTPLTDAASTVFRYLQSDSSEDTKNAASLRQSFMDELGDIIEAVLPPKVHYESKSRNTA